MKKKEDERYYLTENDIQKLHGVELELLIEFDRICRKHNIIYSIDGGTLLGAVRHGGFIPWDDDADVIMNRDEFIRFLNVVDMELDPSRFYLQELNRTKGYRWGYAKLRKKGTSFIRTNQKHLKYEQGIFLDVFVCDNVPDNYYERVFVNFHSFLYRKMFYSVVGKEVDKGISKCLYSIMALIPEDYLKRKYKKYVEYRNRKDSNYCKCLTFPACNKTYGYKKEWYRDVTEIEFEGRKFLACKKSDEYLTFLYGDYMTLPPVEKRKVHPVVKIEF